VDADHWTVVCTKNEPRPIDYLQHYVEYTTNIKARNTLVNGVPVGVTNDPSDGGSVTGGSSTLMINRVAASSSQFQLAELIVWDHHLSDSTMKFVSNYLMAKLTDMTPMLPTVACTTSEGQLMQLDLSKATATQSSTWTKGAKANTEGMVWNGIAEGDARNPLIPWPVSPFPDGATFTDGEWKGYTPDRPGKVYRCPTCSTDSTTCSATAAMDPDYGPGVR
jgi:hypothetical protein